MSGDDFILHPLFTTTADMKLVVASKQFSIDRSRVVEQSSLLPVLKAIRNRRACPEFPLQGVTLHTRPQHVHDGLKGFTIREARPNQAGSTPVSLPLAEARLAGQCTSPA